MNMKIVLLSSEEEKQEFLYGLNLAFKYRSNKDIPFDEFEMDKLIDDTLFSAIEGTQMIAGFGYREYYDNNRKYGRISHVWVHPDFQGKGIAKCLFNFIDEYSVDKKCDFLTLGVADIYKPAVMLYKSRGFKPFAVYANRPNTFRYLEMRKPVLQKENEIQRVCKYAISSFKFFVLFKKNSNPKLLHRIIYKNNRDAD